MVLQPRLSRPRCFEPPRRGRQGCSNRRDHEADRDGDRDGDGNRAYGHCPIISGVRPGDYPCPGAHVGHISRQPSPTYVEAGPGPGPHQSGAYQSPDPQWACRRWDGYPIDPRSRSYVDPDPWHSAVAHPDAFGATMGYPRPAADGCSPYPNTESVHHGGHADAVSLGKERDDGV